MNTKSKPRNELSYTLHRVIEDALVMVDGNTKNCINCVFFRESEELCSKFKQRPPARVIALSCEHHEDCNDIPF